MGQLGQNEIVRVGKNSGPVLSRFLNFIHEIFGQCRRPLVLSSALARLSMSRFVQQIFAISKLSKNRTNVSFLSLICSGGTTPTFLQGIVNAIYRPPFGKVWLSSVC